MLRAVRFAAKLGFTIHPDTAAPIPKLAWMLDGVPPARLFDEVNKMFLAGSAQRSFELLERLAAARAPVSGSRECARRTRRTGSSARELVRLGLAGHRRARARGQVRHADVPVRGAAVAGRCSGRSPSCAHGSERRSAAAARGVRSGDGAPASARRRAEALHVADARAGRLAAALRAARGRRALRLLDHPRFRAAYDFLLLRAAAGEVDAGTGEVVDRNSVGCPPKSASRESSRLGSRARAPRPTAPRRRRRRRRRRPPAAVVSAAVWMPAYVALGSNLDDPPRQIERAFERARGSRRLPARRALAPVSNRAARARRINLSSSTPRRDCSRARAARAAARAEEHRSRARARAARRALGPAADRSRPAACSTTCSIAEPDLTMPHPGLTRAQFRPVSFARYRARAARSRTGTGRRAGGARRGPRASRSLNDSSPKRRPVT